MYSRLVFALLLAAGCPLLAQGSFDFTTGSDVGVSNGNSLIMFEITAQAPLRIWRLGTGHSTTGTTPVDIEVWYRPGGIGTVSPAAPPLTNWVFVGTGQVVPSVANVIIQIPLDINLNLTANETVGFAICRTAGSVRYYNWTTGMGPYANSDVSFNVNGYQGTYSASSNPRFSPVAGGARAFHGTVWYDKGPTLTASAQAGVAQSVTTTEQGAGNAGLGAGLFSIASATDPNATLQSIQLEASGTGDDSTAYSQVALYRDVNNNGIFELGIDLLVAPAATAFPADNGTLTFNVQPSESVFLPSETRSYLVVVKLNGAVPAVHGQTFNFRVSSLGVATGTSASGAPTTVMNGLTIVGPALTPTAIPALPVSVLGTETGVGGNGIKAATFTVTNNALGASQLTSISIAGSGTGDDSTAYSQVAIYEDTDNSSDFEFANDTLYGTAVTAFPSNDGALTFTANAAFAASQARRYFIVCKMNGSTLAVFGQTFNLTVTDLGTGPGTGKLGLPTSTMAGITVTGPQLSVTNVGGAAASVLATDQGPGNNGIRAATFTITANSIGNASLSSITIGASGTGNDSNAFSQVAVYEDTNDNDVYESGTDTLYGTAVTAFGTDNGTQAFTANRAFVADQMRRFFIVVKLNGATLALNGQTFNFSVAALGVGSGTAQFGAPTAAMTGLSINGPVLTVAPITTAAQSVYADALGTGNNGIAAASFTITNNAAASGTLNSITIAASGTGNDATAYSQVALYTDSNSSGSFEFGTDTIYGTAVTAFGTDNGTQIFTSSQTFTASQSRRYFIVVKLNGSTLAGPTHTFNFAVNALALGNGTSSAGTPSGTMTGLTILAPSFTVTDTSPAQVTAYRGSTNVMLQRFTVGYAAGPVNSISSITIGAGGTGNPANDYASVRLYFDSNNDNNFDPGDIQIGTVPAFTAGSAVFTVTGTASQFPPSTVRRYFVIADFNQNAAGNATFTTRVGAAVPGYSGTTFTGVPSAFSAGAVIVLPQFIVTDNSAPTPVNAYTGAGGFTLQQFTVAYPAGPNNEFTSLTITASGTGHDANDYTNVALYLDHPTAGTVGSYDPADTLLDDVQAFTGDNGTITFTIGGPESQFTATTTKQFFVVAAFAPLGQHNSTFAGTVTAGGGTLFGGQFAGLPAGPSAGLILQQTHLQVNINGPLIAVTVDSDSQGPSGDGELLLDFNLVAGLGGSWTVNSITFAAAGTADPLTAYSEVGLYEDNGNGIWEGSAVDAPAAAAQPGFNASGEVVFTLSNTAITAGATRRLFLAAKLAGTATAGQTMNARVESVLGTPALAGVVNGTPSMDSTALIVDNTALTVLSGPGTPAAMTHKAGTAIERVMLMLRLGASNNDVEVTGITLTNTGNGNWVSALDATTGLSVYVDDGDGVYNAADAAIYQGPGALIANIVFTTPLIIGNAQSLDLWIVANFLDTAGNGAATAQTFQSALIGTGSISHTDPNVTVLIGNPAPQSAVFSIVDFFVTDFDPIADLPAGGKAITITGSGFMSPFIVRIGGVVCPGAPVITGGTQVTGLTVPAGTVAANLPIEISSGTLPPQTLTQTFTYANVSSAGDGGGGGGGGCATTDSSGLWLMLAALALLAAPAIRRKHA